MRIGELARVTGTQIETIRYYERERLLALPARTKGNFRIYETQHLERLQFIRYCRSLDMSLDEVRALLKFKDAPAESCGDVNDLLDEHIGHVSRRIRELRTLERHLKELRQRCCEARTAQECGILSELTQASKDVVSAEGRTSNHLRSVHTV